MIGKEFAEILPRAGSKAVEPVLQQRIGGPVCKAQPPVSHPHQARAQAVFRPAIGEYHAPVGIEDQNRLAGMRPEIAERASLHLEFAIGEGEPERMTQVGQNPGDAFELVGFERDGVVARRHAQAHIERTGRQIGQHHVAHPAGGEKLVVDHVRAFFLGHTRDPAVDGDVLSDIGGVGVVIAADEMLDHRARPRLVENDQIDRRAADVIRQRNQALGPQLGSQRGLEQAVDNGPFR